MTTTVSTSFTAVGQSIPLVLNSYDELLTYNISGTYIATIVIDRALTRDPNGAWETVAGPFATEDGTFAGTVYGQKNSLYRVRCTAFTSGTAVTTLADEDVTTRVEKDLDGNVTRTVTQESSSEAQVGAEITYAAGLATVATLGVAVKLVAVTAQKGDASGFTVGTDNTLTATYTGTKLCHVKGRFLVDNETADDALTLHVYVAGASAFETAAQTVTAATQKFYEIDVLLNIANGEAIELYAENEDTTSNVDTIVAAERVDTVPAHGFLRVTSA